MTTDFATDLAIVLTGAITVGVDFVALTDPQERRRQYLTALKFYRDFAPVYFIENSDYDLLSDSEFTSLSEVRLRGFRPLDAREHGKGYQEFSAFDRWYDTERERPRRFLKITGRYLLLNVSEILDECRLTREGVILIDRYERDRSAHTSVFSMSWETYGGCAYGLYSHSDDHAGVWIEHVYYEALKRQEANCRIFAHEPRMVGISGSTGGRLDDNAWRWAAKQSLRSVNHMVDSSRLYWRGGRSKPATDISLDYGLSKALSNTRPMAER